METEKNITANQEQDMDAYARMLSLVDFLREPAIRSFGDQSAEAPFGDPRPGRRMWDIPCGWQRQWHPRDMSPVLICHLSFWLTPGN